jgi:parvulin-like peptidyl-prolyl isomerase
MLKAMRKHARFFYVLFFIVILSFIFWGVGTVDKSTNVAVAEIEKEKISLEEYWLAYDRIREFYRDMMKEGFTEEVEKQLNLKQKVLDTLIDERVLLIAAKRAGITVSEKELEEAIMNDPNFMRDGRFNRDVYLRTLQLNRMTPQFYESLRKRELILTKMRRLIGESIDLPGSEVREESLKQAMLSEMRERAIKSYIEGLKKGMKIKVNTKLLS